jgi:hypothetical protein
MELELKLTQARMAQNPVLWVEVGKALESRTQMRVGFLFGWLVRVLISGGSGRHHFTSYYEGTGFDCN